MSYIYVYSVWYVEYALFWKVSWMCYNAYHAVVYILSYIPYTTLLCPSTSVGPAIRPSQ